MYMIYESKISLHSGLCTKNSQSKTIYTLHVPFVNIFIYFYIYIVLVCRVQAKHPLSYIQVYSIIATDQIEKMSRSAGNERKKSSVQNVKRFGFNKWNVEQTSRIPLGKRDYGFQKTTNTSTPFPKKADPISPQMLVDRLQGAVAHSIVSDTTLSKSSSEERFVYHPKQNANTSGMSFEMKRKLFHEGEFTITKGLKISELHHPLPNYDDMRKNSMKDSQLFAFNEMEKYCRTMNIKMAKGFDN